MFSYSSDKNPEVEYLSHMVVLFSISCGISYCFMQQLHQFTVLPTVVGSLFSTFISCLFSKSLSNRRSFPGCSVGKESACSAGDHLQYRRPGFNLWVRKIPWRRKWQLTPAFLLGKSPRQRNLVDYRPWGCKELHTA